MRDIQISPRFSFGKIMKIINNIIGGIYMIHENMDIYNEIENVKLIGNEM